MSDRAVSPVGDAWRIFWIVFALALLANAAMLVIDREPLFIMGDSMVYVQSAFGTGGPGDRSFAYGRYIIRPLLWLFGSLQDVVAAQAVMAAGCAAMLAFILRLGFGVRRWIACTVALAYVAEPLALLYQRMMMTEAPALFFLAVFLLLGILYLREARIALLAGLAGATAACVSMRVSFLPALIVSMVMLPSLALVREWPVPRPMIIRCAAHLAVAVSLTLAAQLLYRHLYHKVTGLPPGYNSADGFFLLASWAPLLTRADFPDPTLYDRIRPTLGEDPADRFSRPGQRFASTGLIPALIRSEGNDERVANALAARIADNIGLRDPWGVLALGWRTYLDFWNTQIMDHVVEIDEGQIEADGSMIDLFRSRYNEDISGHHLTQTFVKSWHRGGALWYRCVLLTPVVWLVAAALQPRQWRPMLLLGASVIGLLLVDTVVVTEPVVRYLHSVAWLTVLLCGIILQGLINIRAAVRTGSLVVGS